MRLLVRLLVCFLLSFCLQGCDSGASADHLAFVTRRGMGIDKWASIWLIKRHIAPNAEIVWLEEGEESSDAGVFFDTENAFYKRTRQASTFSALIEGFNVEMNFLPSFVQMVHDVEINYWGPSELPYSDPVENQFRRLQAKFGQEKTPLDCYLAFFDKLEAAMPALQTLNVLEHQSLDELMPEASCAGKANIKNTSRTRLVAEWPIETVLKALQLGKRVIFVDVRETEEFEESHIPGAINLKIREMPDFDPGQLADADLVVPYCVKDFRGFEMARLLKQKGISQVVMMRPYGFKGWISLALPIAGHSITEDQGLKKLAACASHLETCFQARSAT